MMILSRDEKRARLLDRSALKRLRIGGYTISVTGLPVMIRALGD
jgi:hypothetical protein